MAAHVLHGFPLSVSDQRVLFSVRGAQVVPQAPVLGAIDVTLAPWVRRSCINLDVA